LAGHGSASGGIGQIDFIATLGGAIVPLPLDVKDNALAQKRWEEH
jgi:hypothetical protein